MIGSLALRSNLVNECSNDLSRTNFKFAHMMQILVVVANFQMRVTSLPKSLCEMLLAK